MMLAGRRLRESKRETAVGRLREAMGDNDFEAAWAEGAALPTDEAIAYAQRGRGERKRPASGWASLTPAELDVVELSVKGWETRTSPRAFSCHRAPCSPTSPTSTPSSASPPACNSRKKQAATGNGYQPVVPGSIATLLI